MRTFKKGSLELSIRAIVIVILAMTLLGLGLGFTRTIFKDIGGISTDVTQQIKQQILDDLITNDKKLSFPTTELLIDRGDSEVITVGVRNKKNVELDFFMEFEQIGDTPDPIIVQEWFQYSDIQYTLQPSDPEVRSIRLQVPSQATSGSYLMIFKIREPNGDVYAQKDFFIVVRG